MAASTMFDGASIKTMTDTTIHTTLKQLLTYQKLLEKKYNCFLCTGRVKVEVSPVKHLQDNSQLIVTLENLDLAQAAEECSKGSFMAWEDKSLTAATVTTLCATSGFQRSSTLLHYITLLLQLVVTMLSYLAGAWLTFRQTMVNKKVFTFLI